MVFSASQRFLSIQSHVVSGYCGNRSATFPLQLLEFEVDVVNTVQLSNHTQYKVVKGQIFESKDLEDIHMGLKGNNLLPLYDYVLSGYVADVSCIRSMANLISDIKLARKKEGLDCWYTFDPVLGDDGTGYYVPNGPDVARDYIKHLLPLADIITPNRFEASILSGQEIDATSEKAIEQALKAIEILHDSGVRIVIITSFEMANKDELMCILSYKQQTGENRIQDLPSQVWSIRVPKLACPFTGTGDLFAALITGWFQKTNFNLKESLENTVNTLQEVLEDTFAWYKHINDNSVRSCELRLVQNKMKILSPKARFKAEVIEKCLS